MKDILEELFSKKRSQGQWKLELHSARQKRNESASEFATRIENILANLINCVTSGHIITPFTTNYHSFYHIQVSYLMKAKSV